MRFLIIFILLTNPACQPSESQQLEFADEILQWREQNTVGEKDIIYLTHLGCRNFIKTVLHDTNSTYLVLIGGDVKRLRALHYDIDRDDFYYENQLYKRGLKHSTAFKWEKGSYRQMTLTDYFLNR